MSDNRSVEERFWSKVDASADCWLWTGPTYNGYGRFKWFGKTRQAHRMAWQLLVGPCPMGKVTDHLCRTRSCVNPDHVEWVANGENVRRGFSPSTLNRLRTHCLRGHPYDADLHGKRLHRGCKTCRRMQWPITYQRRKARLAQRQVAA